MHQILHVTPKDWQMFSPNMHALVFEEARTPDMDRITGAYIVLNDEGNPYGYITYMEKDKHTIYMQFGGVTINKRGTANTWRAYKRTLDKLLATYLCIQTKVEPKNTTYIQMALKAGFIITGFEVSNTSLVLMELRRGK